MMLKFLFGHLISLNLMKFDFILRKEIFDETVTIDRDSRKSNDFSFSCFNTKLIFAKIRALRILEIQYHYSRFSTNPRKKMLLYIVHCRLIDLCSLMVSSDYRVS